MADDNITKGERDELRRMVRSQFKVLRKEVEQRRQEMVADIDTNILGRFRTLDEEREKLDFELKEWTAKKNVELAELLKARTSGTGLIKGYKELDPPFIQWAGDRRYELHAAAVSSIDADVKGALLRLERQEADLLRNLTVGALETEAAHAFLAAIPTVGELVPAARMAELEAALGVTDADLVDPDAERPRWGGPDLGGPPP